MGESGIKPRICRCGHERQDHKNHALITQMKDHNNRDYSCFDSLCDCAKYKDDRWM